MIDTPQILQTTAQPSAVLPLVIPRSEIQNAMGPAITEVYAAVAAQGIAPAGPWFTHHLQRPTETFDLEVCVPIGTPIQPTGRVKPSQWPAMKVARTLYRGPYEGLSAAWGEFHAWIAAERLSIAPDLWERYLVGPDSTRDPADWRTELNCQLIA